MNNHKEYRNGVNQFANGNRTVDYALFARLSRRMQASHPDQLSRLFENPELRRVDTKSMAIVINAVQESQANRMGQEPTIAEVAYSTGMSPNTVIRNFTVAELIIEYGKKHNLLPCLNNALVNGGDNHMAVESGPKDPRKTIEQHTLAYPNGHRGEPFAYAALEMLKLRAKQREVVMTEGSFSAVSNPGLNRLTEMALLGKYTREHR